jgi:heat shock protein HtpX
VAETQQPVLVWDRVDANRRNTVLLLGLFALISLPAAAYVAQYLAFVVTIFVFSASGDDWMTAFIAGAIIVVAIVVAAAYLQYRYASAAVLRFAGGREVERDEEPDLWRTVENLCIGAGPPSPPASAPSTRHSWSPAACWSCWTGANWRG